MENGILSTNAVGFTSASASLVNASNALNNMADGQLFEMYNGFSEANAHNLANRRYGTLADDLFDQNFVEIKGTTIIENHSQFPTIATINFIVEIPHLLRNVFGVVSKKYCFS